MVQDRRMKLVDYGNQPSPTTLPVRLSSLRHIQPHAILSQEICFVTYRGICTRVSVLVHFSMHWFERFKQGRIHDFQFKGAYNLFLPPNFPSICVHVLSSVTNGGSMLRVNLWIFLENRHWFWWTLMHFDTTNYSTLYSPVLQLYRNV